MSINTLSPHPSITEPMKEEAEEQIRKLKKEVDYNTIEYPVELIVEKYSQGKDDDENELFIPDYQREMAWDEKRQSKFIESILLGLPIPPLYVADISDESSEDGILDIEDLGRWEIIDGSQRLRTLVRFMKNEFRLQGLEKLDKLEGFAFSDFPLARRRRFQRTSIRIVQLTEKTDEETRRDLFERINTGGVQLNEMERRRGIHTGAFLNLIDELAKEERFLNRCHFSNTSIDKKDPQEYVLRFFAFLNKYQNFEAQNLTEFLDQYLKKTNEANEIKPTNSTETNKANSENLNRMKEEFYKMLSFVESYFPHGFYQQTKTSCKPVTRIKFESLSVGIALALRENSDLTPQAESLKLLESEKYQEYTKGDGSSSKNKVIRRIEYVRDQLLGE